MPSTVRQTLPRSTPEQQGVTSAGVLDFVQALDRQINEMHSFMLLRHGCVVAEGWWSPYGREYPHMLFSLSKSFTSTAVGLAVAEGRFSLDDSVLSFFSDDAPANADPLLTTMRVRHLLSMSTGHAVDTWGYMLERPDGNWIKGFLEVPVQHTPGTHFLYNTGATYMLSAIVQQTTGMKLVDYLQPRLFEPLGVEDPIWEESPQGINSGGIGLSLKTEEIARFGQLYLQQGVWHDKQLIPQAWAIEATTKQIANGDDPYSDWAQGYGYQFWRCRHNAYRGDGVFGQYCIIMPEQDAVLAITGGVDALEMQPPLNLVWNLLLPAMHPDPLPDDPSSQQRLNDALSGLSLPPVQGQATSPSAAQVSKCRYRIDSNPRSIETVTLNFGAASCTLKINTSAGEQAIPCGYADWQYGHTTLFNEPAVFDPAPIAASGAWTAEDRFTVIVRLYHTPFYHTIDCYFVGDELLMEIRVNVSLDSTKPLLLTGRIP